MRSFTALVNPVAGGGAAGARWRPVAEALIAAGAEVDACHTRDPEHAVRLATSAAGTGRVVVAVGGDGLVRDAAEGTVAAGGTLAVVPAGRGNDLAAKLGIPAAPARHAELARLLLTGRARPLDVLDAGGRIVPGNVYAGVDSVSTEMINNSRWIPAALLYRLAPARAMLTWRPPTYTVVADGETTTARAHIVVVANSGTYGHGLKIVPDAVVDDGLLDILVVEAGPKRQLAPFMNQARHGTHINRPEVSVRRARRVTLTADRPVPVAADGDNLGSLPCTVTLRPAALDVITPDLL